MKICVSKDIYTSRAQKMIPKTALIESRVVSENRISTINLLDQKAEKVDVSDRKKKIKTKLDKNPIILLEPLTEKKSLSPVIAADYSFHGWFARTHQHLAAKPLISNSSNIL